MSRLFSRKTLEVAFGLCVIFGVAATRTEKLFAEMQLALPDRAGATISSPAQGLPELFDPARVPVSGGMAARLLAGISVKTDQAPARNG